MLKDPVVEEIHRLREQIVKDGKTRGITLLDYLKEIQKQASGPIVTKADLSRK